MIGYGNSVFTRYVYDPLNFGLQRMRSEQYDQTGFTFSPDAGVKQDLLYSYDLSGNFVKITDRKGVTPVNRNFTYDALYRLLSATGITNNQPNAEPWEEFGFDSGDPNAVFDYTQLYTYDKLGNVQQLQQTGDLSFTRDFAYTEGKNTLEEVTIGGNNYGFTYDVNGNLLTQAANQNYFWDARDQLVKFERTNTSTVTQRAYYLYDAGGNRTKKVVHNLDGSTVLVTNYIDGAFEHEIYTAATAAFERNYTHIADDTRKLATLRVGDRGDDIPDTGWYILDDYLGSSNLRLSLATGGAIIDREEYFPFGESSFRNFNRKRYRFCGKERDLETGLYYSGARYYLPWLCRFISVDPKAVEYIHQSSYVFADNNPVGKVDVNGEGTESSTLDPIVNDKEIQLVQSESSLAALEVEINGPSEIPLFDPSGKFKNLYSTSFPYLYKSFDSAPNSSLGHLQKFRWSPKGSDYYKNSYNKMKGIAGEGIISEMFSSFPLSIEVQSFLDPDGDISAVGPNYQILHPDKLTDFKTVALLKINPKGVPNKIKHGFIREIPLIWVAPSLKMEEYKLSTTFIYEIKTNKEDGENLYTERNINKGVSQLINNPAVQAGAVPVLVLDTAYFLAAIKSGERSTLNSAIRTLAKFKGGIMLVDNLNKDAIAVLEAMKKIIVKTDKPPPNFH